LDLNLEIVSSAQQEVAKAEWWKEGFLENSQKIETDYAVLEGDEKQAIQRC